MNEYKFIGELKYQLEMLSMMKVFTGIFFLLGWYCVCSICSKVYRGHGRKPPYDRYDGACGIKNPPIEITLEGAEQIGSKLFLNITVNITEDVGSEMKLRINIERCANKENLDTCEPFYNFKNDELCLMVNTASLFWRPIMASFKPPVHCPLNTTVYRSYNTVVDRSAFLLFPTESWYWRIKVHAYRKDNNKHLLSMCVDMRH